MANLSFSIAFSKLPFSLQNHILQQKFSIFPSKRLDYVESVIPT